MQSLLLLCGALPCILELIRKRRQPGHFVSGSYRQSEIAETSVLVFLPQREVLGLTRGMGLAVAAVPLLYSIAGWVLNSPYSRPVAGLGYNIGTNPQEDWTPASTVDLDLLVMRWGAAPITSSSGLGKSISYAVHPTFCEKILPKFPEDGGSCDNCGGGAGMITFLSCGDLMDHIQNGFDTWHAPHTREPRD